MIIQGWDDKLQGSSGGARCRPSSEEVGIDARVVLDLPLRTQSGRVEKALFGREEDIKLLFFSPT